MDRSVIAVALVTLLLVVGAGLTAATLTQTYSPDFGPGQGTGTQNGNGESPATGEIGEGSNENLGQGSQQPDLLPKICIEILQNTLVIAGGVLFILGLTAVVYTKISFVASMFVFYLLGLPALIGYGLFTQCGAPAESGGGSGLDEAIAQAVGQGGGSLTTVQPPLWLVVGITVVFALVAVGALASASRTEDLEAPEDEEWVDEPDLEQFAEAAGRAADRIEQHNADVDNAVYRAWQEMTGLLNVENPEVYSPREFASEAVELGMLDEDVDRLTTLFEEVRYGDMDPEPREDLAVDTLRAIQDRYSEIADGAEDGDGKEAANEDDPDRAEDDGADTDDEAGE